MAAFTIPTIYSAIDKFSRPVKNMANTAEASAARMERSFRRVGDAASRIARTGLIIGSAIAIPLGIAAKQAIDFEAKMSNVATIVDTSKESMAAMSNEVLQLSTRLPSSVDDLTTSLYDIRSAGIDSANAMGVLEHSSKLSVAGLSTAAEATNITTSAVNAFASEGKSAGEITDILFKTVKAGKTDIGQLSQAFGGVAPSAVAARVSLSELSAATAALTLSGLPTSQAQNKLKALFEESTRTSGKLSDAYKKLVGGNIAAAVESKGFMTVLSELKTAVGGSETAFKNMFSSVEAGGAALTLMGSGNEAYIKTLDDMTKGGNAVEEAFNKQLKTGANQAQIARNNMQALSITVGTELIPVITATIQKVTPLIKGFIGWAKANPGTMKTLVLLTAAVAAFSFTVSGVSFVVALVSKAMAAWGLITKGLTAAQWLLNVALTANPIGIIIVAIAALIGIIVAAIAKYNEWGAALLLVLGPLGWIVNMIQSFRRNWDLITQAFREGGILAGIKMIGKTLLDAVLMPIQQIVELIAKITGATWAENAVKSIQKFRADLGVNTTTDESGEPLAAQAVNPQAARQEALAQRIETTNRQNVSIDIKDQTGRASMQSDNDMIPIRLTSTMGF